MANIKEVLTELAAVEGAIGIAIVDFKSGMTLGLMNNNGNFNLEVAAAGNAEVVRAKLKVMQSIGLKDRLDDILITLGSQYHLIRPLTNIPHIFMYFALNRAQSNLALARHKLAESEQKLEL
jgi:hypothetical protein